MANKMNLLNRILGAVGIIKPDSEQGYPDDGYAPRGPENRGGRTYTPESVREAQQNAANRSRPGNSSRFGSSVNDESEQDYAGQGSERAFRSNDPRTMGRSPMGGRRDGEAPSGRSHKNVPMAQPGKNSKPEIIVAYVSMIEDVKPLINALVRGNTLLITLDTSDPMMRQRLVDMVYGAAYALGASFNKASHSNLTFIITPRGTALLRYSEFNS